MTLNNSSQNVGQYMARSCGLVNARALAMPYDWDMVVATESTRCHTLRVRRLYMADAMAVFQQESTIWDHHKVLAPHIGA